MAPDNSKYYGTLTADELSVLQEFGATRGITFQDLMRKWGNGSGMTRNVLTPLARRLLEVRAAERREAEAGGPNANDVPSQKAKNLRKNSSAGCPLKRTSFQALLSIFNRKG